MLLLILPLGLENTFDKIELYRQCPTRGVKYTKISEIENTSCLRNFIRVTPVYGTEREPWGAACIMRKVNYGVYICTCNFKSDEYECWTKHEFVYESNFKPFHQSQCCGDLIDNRDDAPIFVLEDNDKETKLNLRHALKDFFGGQYTLEYFYKTTPCKLNKCYHLYIFIGI